MSGVDGDAKRRGFFRAAITALALASFATAATPLLSISAEEKPVPPTPPTHPAPPAPGMAGFPDLVGGLKATPGCLGVETARTESGKNVIFAWFEDKKAALRWYYSEVHQEAMRRFFPHREHRTPLERVTDDSGPILAIASITFAERGQHEETTLPVSQIAIELYQPLPGGLFLGGRFAPESVHVDGMNDYTPKEKD